MMMMMKCTTMLVVLLGMAFLVEGLSANNLEVDKRMNVRTDDVRAEKRNLWQFGKMIKCATGKNALKYNNYGKWCGWGGKGKPVDGVDRCCKTHDLCYDHNESCSPKLTSYAYTTSGKYPSCKITCKDNGTKNNECKMNVCKCDKAAAECFAKNTYNKKNKNRGLFR